jgi:hypothetical protein
MAEELLAVPGSSGVDVSARESTPPVPAADLAAVVEPAGKRSTATAGEQVVAAKLAEMELSVQTAGSAEAAPAAEPAAVVGLMSEALSVLALEPEAVEESAAGVLVVEPAVTPAAEPVAATAAVSAAVPTAARGGRPVLADGPVAAPRECWVMNPGIAPKVIVRRIPSGSAAAAESATSWEIRAGGPCQSRDLSQRQGGPQRRR